MRNTYSGGCHCGTLRYTATLDLAAGTYRCNCTICQKLRNWIIPVPAADFAYTKGADQVALYNPIKGGVAQFHFCPNCGVRMGTRVEPTPESRFAGGPRFNLSVTTLEHVEEADLIAAPVTWVDGLNDIWDAPPAETRHL